MRACCLRSQRHRSNTKENTRSRAERFDGNTYCIEPVQHIGTLLSSSAFALSRPLSLRKLKRVAQQPILSPTSCDCAYHYIQNAYRTGLYDFRIIFGNSWSVITKPTCFWNYGLGKKCEQRITESLTELFWELYSVIWVEEWPNRNCFGLSSEIFLCDCAYARQLMDMEQRMLAGKQVMKKAV